MSAREAVLVVSDPLGILEVFGPYAVGSAVLAESQSQLVEWVERENLEAHEVEIVPLGNPVTLGAFIASS